MSRIGAWLQARADNSAFHHIYVANGPLWRLCPLCRAVRGSDA